MSATRNKFLSAWLPPPHREDVTPQKVARTRSTRLVAVGFSIFVDVLLVATLRHSPHIDSAAIETFGLINIPLLVIDFGVTFFWLRERHRYYDALHIFVSLIECFTSVVWLQLTGSLSSYFLFIGFMLITIYRCFVSYRIGLITTIGIALMHIGMVSFEELGWLTRASAFVQGSSPVYDSELMRLIAISTIAITYAGWFAGINLVMIHLRDTQLALQQAQERMVRIEDGARHGRLTGSTLESRYELSELLGRGGMGEVYRGRRMEDGKPCAIKVLHPHLLDDPAQLQRFEKEAVAAGRLPVRFVPEVMDMRVTKGNERYIVMELLRGEDLAALLRRRGRLEPDEAMPILAAVATALDAAHDANIVHRDLKPQNIFLVEGEQSDRSVRLLDFGISKLLEAETELTVTRAVLGSPGYMAPEQARGSAREAGPEADLFALGAIAYRALTGERPFRARGLADALYQIVHEHPDPATVIVPELHADVDAVLALALAKSPSERYGRGSDFVSDLDDALRGELDGATRERGHALIEASMEATRTAARSV